MPGISRIRGQYSCRVCGKAYKWYSGLYRHRTFECGKAPRFQCPYCDYVAKQRPHIYTHIKATHRNRQGFKKIDVYAIDLQKRDPIGTD
ncbi:hypothetical protein TKK_0011285 [Trichogramma kaykai]|uniref:C2H2-type domain-containing protein n=1 Tax=Trichogramma kaykai TaxID=54128 RepID=A0ABD2WTF3_9HYME